MVTLEPDEIDSKGQPGPLHPLNKNFLKNIRKEDLEWGLKQIEEEKLKEVKPKDWPQGDNWPGDPEQA